MAPASCLNTWLQLKIIILHYTRESQETYNRPYHKFSLNRLWSPCACSPSSPSNSPGTWGAWPSGAFSCCRWLGRRLTPPAPSPDGFLSTCRARALAPNGRRRAKAALHRAAARRAPARVRAASYRVPVRAELRRPRAPAAMRVLGRARLSVLVVRHGAVARLDKHRVVLVLVLRLLLDA